MLVKQQNDSQYVHFSYLGYKKKKKKKIPTYRPIFFPDMLQ